MHFLQAKLLWIIEKLLQKRKIRFQTTFSLSLTSFSLKLPILVIHEKLIILHFFFFFLTRFLFIRICLQVCIGRLHDFQLAMVLARLYEEDISGGLSYTRILKECLLGQGDNPREPSQGKLQMHQGRKLKQY